MVVVELAFLTRLTTLTAPCAHLAMALSLPYWWVPVGENEFFHEKLHVPVAAAAQTLRQALLMPSASPL